MSHQQQPPPPGRIAPPALGMAMHQAPPQRHCVTLPPQMAGIGGHPPPPSYHAQHRHPLAPPPPGRPPQLPPLTMHMQQQPMSAVFGGPSGIAPSAYDRVRNWEGYLIPDSGIHSGMQSGIHSGAPSVMSNVSDLHDEVIQSYELMSMSGSEGGGPSMAPRFVDVATSCNAVRGLIDLFNDQDMVVIRNTAQTANDLMKSPMHVTSMKHERTLLRDFITAILRALERVVTQPAADKGDDSDKDLVSMKYLSNCILQLSMFPEVSTELVDLSAVETIIRALQWSPPDCPNHSYFCFLIVALHNMVAKNPDVDRRLRNMEAERILTPLIVRQPPIQYLSTWPKLVSIIVDCLNHVCSTSKAEPKKRILQLGGTKKLVELMHTSTYEKLLYHSARLLKVLSNESENKRTIFDCGGVFALVKPFDHASQRLLTNCLLCLRNLSDLMAKTDQDIREVIDKILALLGCTSYENTVNECCAGILQNATASSALIKEYVVLSNRDPEAGRDNIAYLVRALGMSISHRKTTEPILCTLRHLTNGHSYTDEACRMVVQHEGLPLVFQLIQTRDPSLSKSGWTLMKNMAQSPAVREVLIKQLFPSHSHNIGFIQLAIDTFNNAYGALFEAIKGGQDPANVVFDSVKAYQLMTLPLLFLSVMAQDRAAKKQIDVADCRFLARLMEVLSQVDDTNTSVAALVLLTDLAEEPDVAQVIEQVHQNRVEPLFNNLITQNQSAGKDRQRIAAAATLLVEKLNSYHMSRTTAVLDGNMVTMMDDDSFPWAPGAESMAIGYDGGPGPSSMRDAGVPVGMESQNMYPMQPIHFQQYAPQHPGGAGAYAGEGGLYMPPEQMMTDSYGYASPPMDVYMSTGMEAPTPSPAAVHGPTTPNYGQQSLHPNTPLQQPLPPSLPPQR